MAKELNLDVEGNKFSWLDIMSEQMGEKDLKDDVDVLAMTRSVGYFRKVNIYAKVRKVFSSNFSDVVIDGGIYRDEEVTMN